MNRIRVNLDMELQELKPAMWFALIGELGTGKTTLTKSIAEGLGIRE
jgi:tRNA A37 threonylcarbamoyladenosine biosynthesis protein TsaE